MYLHILGIDVSKLKFNVCLIGEDGRLRHRVFANNSSGFTQLSEWLKKNHVGQLHACLEATGTYSQALATYLSDAGHRVSLVNPAATKAYAGAQLSRTKTDRVDAELIARFCLTQKPQVWTPPAPEVRELQALVRRLDALLEMQVMESNRLSSGVWTAEVSDSIESVIEHLEEQIKRTEKLIQKHINKHPQLKADCDLLLSIPGLGEATIARLMSEINFHRYESARQVAAFAGLVPRLRESGKSVRGRARLSKTGTPRIRHSLYFPAITALRCNPVIKEWASGLSERGKSKMQIICA
ncbi:MAG: IS110 family transposase, partial [Acidobacteria bacterium]|nr:IS110 family transposase [Acidobacteriota bacterium]